MLTAKQLLKKLSEKTTTLNDISRKQEGRLYYRCLTSEGKMRLSVFLTCSDSENKTNIVKVIRSILRENFRRHIKCDLPLEKSCKDRLVPLKNRVPATAKLGKKQVYKVKNGLESRVGRIFTIVNMTVVSYQTHKSHFFFRLGSCGDSSLQLSMCQELKEISKLAVSHYWFVISWLKGRFNKAQINFAG